jgi:hypothetical protein
MPFFRSGGDGSWPILLKNSFSGATRKITGPQRRRSFSGFGGPCDVLLRATKSLLTNAPTIRGVDCRLQGTIARIRGEYNLGFFNRIGQKKTVEYFPHSSHSITLLVG